MHFGKALCSTGCTPHDLKAKSGATTATTRRSTGVMKAARRLLTRHPTNCGSESSDSRVTTRERQLVQLLIYGSTTMCEKQSVLTVGLPKVHTLENKVVVTVDNIGRRFLSRPCGTASSKCLPRCNPPNRPVSRCWHRGLSTFLRNPRRQARTVATRSCRKQGWLPIQPLNQDALVERRISPSIHQFQKDVNVRGVDGGPQNRRSS